MWVNTGKAVACHCKNGGRYRQEAGNCWYGMNKRFFVWLENYVAGTWGLRNKAYSGAVRPCCHWHWCLLYYRLYLFRQRMSGVAEMKHLSFSSSVRKPLSNNWCLQPLMFAFLHLALLHVRLIFLLKRPVFRLNRRNWRGWCVTTLAAFTKIANGAVGHCLGAKGINLLMSTLQNRLVDHG